MAGKESGGAALAEAALFDGAAWLFTPLPGDGFETELEVEWRGWVGRFGCRVVDMEAGRHDVVCAWVSHLPQIRFDRDGGHCWRMSFVRLRMVAEEFLAIGGRALREMTRLGASPYSDVAGCGA